MANSLNATLTSNNRSKLGIIAAPGWFDPTLQEFESICPGTVQATQTILAPVGFDYSFDQIERLEPHLASAGQLLAEAGSQLVAQIGPAFAYFHDNTPQGARALQQRLSEVCRTPVILNGVAVLDALQTLDCRRIALACPYYDPHWKARFLHFLQPLELTIDSCETFVEQRIFATQAEVDARHYQFSDDEIRQSIRQTRDSAPDAELMLVGGAGVRFITLIEALEAELGIPVLSADVALYWAISRALNIDIPNRKLGTLLRM